MRDNEEAIYYEVVLEGDQYDHEQFREQVHEVGGEIHREVEVDTMEDDDE